MSSVSTLDAVLQQTATVNANVAQTPPESPEPDEDDSSVHSSSTALFIRSRSTALGHCQLVERVEGSELYACFDPARLDDAKAVFVWACGDGIDKPARADIAACVLELKDPEKFDAKQEEKRKAEEAKAKAAAEGAADDDGLIQRV